jgi:hypothetical protein
MPSRLTALAALGAILLSIGSAPASANHPGCSVGGTDGWYTDNQEVWLGPEWINWGAWDSTGDYIARRYSQYWEVTYAQWQPGSDPIHWASTSGNQLHYRYSAQQRAGYGWRQYGFSHYHCDPR